jgi:carboxyl-terminal processing protease
MVQKRLVHGGGGIKPDVYVPYDSGRLTPDLLDLLMSDGLLDAIWDYYSLNYQSLRQYRTVNEFNRNFTSAELVLNNYLKDLSPAQQMGARAVLSRPANRAYLLLEIRSQMARILFRNTGYYFVNTKGDELIQRALQILRSPQYQKLISR